MFSNRGNNNEVSNSNNVPRSGARRFQDEYAELSGLDLEKLGKKIKCMYISTMNDCTLKTRRILVTTTFNLWKTKKSKNQDQQIDAAIKKALEPENIIATTEDTSVVINKIDLANPSKELEDYINKCVKA